MPFNVSIAYNTMENNGGAGVAIDSKGAAYPDRNFTIEYNNFITNSTDFGDSMSVIADANDYNGALLAINNWWNSPSAPGGDATGTGKEMLVKSRQSMESQKKPKHRRCALSRMSFDEKRCAGCRTETIVGWQNASQRTGSQAARDPAV